MGRTTCDVLVERLTDWGVDTIFGLPGDGINGFMESLRTAQGRIRFIHVRHEEVGALAACAYAKFTGKLGVCMSTAGPGAVHLLNGLYDAKCDQASVLAITGMSYQDLIGTNYLQDINQDYLFDNVALYNQRVMGPAHISNLADQACRTALGRRGPTHLCIPIDIQHQEVSAGHRSHRNLKGHTSTRFQPPARTPEKDELELAASALKGKRKIAILAGQGARGAGPELEALAEKLGAPIVKALLGKDAVSDDSPYCRPPSPAMATAAGTRAPRPPSSRAPAWRWPAACCSGGCAGTRGVRAVESLGEVGTLEGSFGLGEGVAARPHNGVRAADTALSLPRSRGAATPSLPPRRPGRRRAGAGWRPPRQ